MSSEILITGAGTDWLYGLFIVIHISQNAANSWTSQLDRGLLEVLLLNLEMTLLAGWVLKYWGYRLRSLIAEA